MQHRGKSKIFFICICPGLYLVAAQTWLQEQLKTFVGAQVKECRTLPGLNNLVNASTTLTIGIEMQGQPLGMDVAAFAVILWEILLG